MSVDSSGLKLLLKDLLGAKAAYPKAEQAALQQVGDATVTELRRMIKAGEIKPEKKGPGVTLIRKDVLEQSFAATVAGHAVNIDAEGQNTNMSNHDLSELLEYGDGKGLQARPHQRLAGDWAEKHGPAIAGQAVAEHSFAKIGGH